MIFVTVGTQLPFDRMVRTVDDWAGRSGRQVFAQIGPTTYQPRHIAWSQFLDAEACHRHIAECSAVVAHAGMGSILKALELGKPVVVMPRRAELREHRNDHQMATARRLLSLGRIVVAFDEEHLGEKLEQLAMAQPRERISKYASPQLLGALQQFVTGAEVAAVIRSRMNAALVADRRTLRQSDVAPSPDVAVPIGAVHS